MSMQLKLKPLLLSLQGRFVPHERHVDFLPDDVFQRMNVGGVVFEKIHPDDTSRVTMAKEYFLNTFYKEAPIPRALKLGNAKSGLSYQNNEATKKFLNNEMDLYLRSGGSIMFSQNNECVGFGFSTIWKKDDRYKVIGQEFDLMTWHKTGAQLAAEHPNPFERHLVWREVQFQHIYNLGQLLLRKHNKSMAFYAGMLYFSPSVRDLGLSNKMIANISQLCHDSNAIYYCQINFRGFDKFLERQCKNPRIVDYIKYDDEDLVLPEDNGEKAFKMLSNLDGIRFYADFSDEEETTT